MPSHDPVRRNLQARTAIAVRYDLPAAQELRRELAAKRLEDYIRDIVATAPPLTEEQKRKLSVLLNSGTAA